MPEFDWRSPESYKSLQDAEITDIAWECLRRNADYRRDYEAMIASSPRRRRDRRNSGGGGASAFAHDPQRSFDAADDLLGARGSRDGRSGHMSRLGARSTVAASQPLLDLAAGQVRRAADGWHAGAAHRSAADHRDLVKRAAGASARHYAAELPFDGDFEMRAQMLPAGYGARSMASRPDRHSSTLSSQRRQRLGVALRALDARRAASYRVIAEVLFGTNVFPSTPGKPTICAIGPFVSCKAVLL